MAASLAFWAAALALVTAPAHAQSEGPAIALTLENDVIRGTDQGYTSGFAWTYQGADNKAPASAVRLARFLPFFDGTGDLRFSASLGQLQFTPEDTQRRTPDPTDRPYAGYAFLGLGLTDTKPGRQDRVSLDLGLVGPSALGEQLQDLAHDFSGDEDSLGWDSQLEDEPVFRVGLERVWRQPIRFSEAGWGADMLPSLSLALGTVETSLGAGLGFRVGRNLQQHFGPGRLHPGRGGPAQIAPTGTFYGFIGLEGRAVAQNIFLDGNTFTDSPSVDKNTFVADFTAGFVWAFNRFSLTAMAVHRTKEFEDQDDNDVFASVTIAIKL